ncbi:MAG: CoA-binding protein [Smithella sp.]|jgi:predicted CoA-binding protein
MSLSYKHSVLMREYLSPRAMAVVGASNARSKFGNLVCRELKARGFRVYPVNPHEKEICSERCHRTINELGDRIDRILIVLPPILTEQIIMELNPAIISYVWMQNGAESPEALRICHAKGIRTIYGQCILMHAEPVRSYHLLHRWWAMSVHSQFSMVRSHCKGET